ncbi:hypothetical protein PIB30_033203 [Stylosanthes scabra]|uniref:Uncharacterized protein n=1 Tax=Stylosanthes scabra TaxID=79078 RepID=A0ABU6SCL4_9FABA|nr:hypothetical protein [Stylosanthes scabra]
MATAFGLSGGDPLACEDGPSFDERRKSILRERERESDGIFYRRSWDPTATVTQAVVVAFGKNLEIASHAYSACGPQHWAWPVPIPLLMALALFSPKNSINASELKEMLRPSNASYGFAYTKLFQLMFSVSIEVCALPNFVLDVTCIQKQFSIASKIVLLPGQFGII